MKVGGQILWNVKTICEASQIYHLMGRRPMKDLLGNHSKDRLFHLVHWLSITLFLRKTSQESINLDRKSYLDFSSDTLCSRAELGRVTYWLQTLRSWRRWTHRKSTQKKTQCKEVIFPKRKWRIYFPIADGRIKHLGVDQDLRTSTLVRHQPIRGESQRDFFGESAGSLPLPQESFPDAGEAINDFWSMSGNFIYRHHFEPRVKLCSPTEKSLPIPLKYIDVSRTTCTKLDVMQERRIDDYWNVDGSRDLSDSWTGFTEFTLFEEKPPNGFLWSGWRLTRKQLTSRPDHLWPELWKSMGKNAKLKEKQEWSNEKLHLENARKLRRIYFIDPKDKGFKETIKNARKKLETSVAPAMPCKIMKNCGSGASNKIKTRLACILEASESTRLRVEESLPKLSWGPHCWKRRQLTTTLQFIPMPQATKIPTAKAAVDKEWEKLEKIPAWDMAKSRTNLKWLMKQRLTDGHVSFNECWIGDKAPKVQRSSCSPRWFCKRQLWIICSIHWTRIISITNDGSKSYGYHFQIAWLRRTSSGRSICLYHQVKMKDAPKLLKIPKSECPDIWIRLPRHKWPKSWSSMEDPVVPLERNLYGHPLAGLLSERPFENILSKHGWE